MSSETAADEAATGFDKRSNGLLFLVKSVWLRTSTGERVCLRLENVDYQPIRKLHFVEWSSNPREVFGSVTNTTFRKGKAMKGDEADGQATLVYLVRHGQAAPGAVDPARPLTAAGRQSVGRMAEWAAAAGVQVDLILHSGKLRAEQTAEILARHLKPPRGVAATEGLRPNDAVGYAHDLILTENGPLMLVGHLPHLGRLVAHLVAGDADRPLVEFDAAAFVSLVQREQGWCISCVNQSRLLQ